ncbi:sensor histidine kinase [Paeniglutamicibacter cryotolerans]|uniref:histidine kinase n=1 Tax=Paeniglutamicibacter cryotolerans TaxID=670079 RepID=A0A839QMM7_9MICC|nr:histidine kinase [Paeniglutamicibacter cryotolerans]MBB2995855.1 signal transduction histidine kinase [Paeniglutamicibacter cryotolerans]
MMTRSRPPLAVLTVAVALIQVIGTLLSQRRQDTVLDPWGFSLLLAGPALLLLRRRAPGPMVAGIAAVSCAYLLLGQPWGPFPLSLAVGLLIAVGAGKRWWAWGSAAGAGTLFALFPGQGGTPLRWAFTAVWLIVLLLVGELARMGSERRAEARRVYSERRRHHRDEERLVLARDIHDVVAHSLSMINVQASVALHLARRDPDPANLIEALRVIKDGSGEALTEVRGVLGELRQDAPRVPSQRLEQLGELVERVRTSGLEIEARLPGFPLPGWVEERDENTLYRAAQEALTNVVRHGSAARVSLTLVVDGQAAELTVLDDGVGPGEAPEGNGLRGMRERVTARGGRLEAGKRPDGTGMLLHVVLPAAERPGEVT